MKDKHTFGGKMARNSRKIAILLLLFILIQTIVAVLKSAKLLNELALNKCQTMPDNLLPYRNWFSSPYIPTREQIMPSALLLA